MTERKREKHGHKCQIHSNGREDNLRTHRPNTNRRAFQPEAAKHSTLHMSLQDIKRLQEKTPVDILKTISSPESGFTRLLATLAASDEELIANVLFVLQKILDAHSAPDLVVRYLHKLSASTFFLSTIIPYMTRMIGRWHLGNNINALMAICHLTEAFQESIPAYSMNLVTMLLGTLRGVSELLMGVSMKASLIEKLESMLSTQELRISNLHEEDKNPDEVEPPSDFRRMSIFPTGEDIVPGVEVFLRKNKLNGSYRDTDQYLDTHFRLLREDYIMYLRQGIQMLKRSKMAGVGNYTPDNVHIYTNVVMKDIRFCNKGALSRLQFDVSKLKHVSWESTQRLKDGQLVCLSPDDFETFTTGIIYAPNQETNPAKLKEGIIDVLINDCRMIATTSDEIFVMVESVAYFESYRHTLKSLQELNGQTLPLIPYILNKTIDGTNPPKYILEDTTYDFRPILCQSQCTNTEVRLLNKETWPEANALGLDKSQCNALHAAITNEFSLIQGPPGTGKTFIGLKIVQLLLNNFDEWSQPLPNENRQRKPLLIVCYTNHALDQFLEGILKFEKAENVIRIGGRCTSTDMQLQQCILRNVKWHGHGTHVVRREVARVYSQLKELEEALLELKKYIHSVKHDMIPIEDLYEVMIPSHRYFFEQDIVYGDQPVSLEDWLNLSSITKPNKSKVNEESNATTVKWQTPQSKRKDDPLLNYLHECVCMTEEEEVCCQNLGSLCSQRRWSLYRLWLRKLGERVTFDLVDRMQRYNLLAAELHQRQAEEDLCILRRAHVIAMTTTGAAKRRYILQEIDPRIVIVEEAAEVLEAHIVTSLSRNCQHLILIGDHQQLRPNPNVYKLARKYHLDISLFERMLRSNLHCESLKVQHRMRPEIAQLIVPHIYKELLNHRSVQNLGNIPGLSGNVLFVNHQSRERPAADSRSHSNIHEATYVTALCKYLIQQGLSHDQITILTTYKGQVYEMKRHVTGSAMTSKVRVTAVDNYQGEENDVILLSLVRSNEEGKAGFIKTSNRICVALSRARKGLYVIGNMTLFEESSPIWRNILEGLRREGKVVTGIPLYCQIHTGYRFNARDSFDFNKAPDGGCMRPCEARLKCGHVCRLKCHPADRDHTNYQCTGPCNRKCSAAGHSCPKQCFEVCGECQVIVEKEMSSCGHVQIMPCYLNQDDFQCQGPCSMKCGGAGHICPKICSETCGDCQVIMEKTIPDCGHLQMVPCYLDPKQFQCQKPCQKLMSCTHVCPKKCGALCMSSKKCLVTVPEREWPCGHTLDVECFKNATNFPCPKQVEFSLQCGHLTTLICSTVPNTIRCEKIITVTLCERSCRNRGPCFLKHELVCENILMKTCRVNLDHAYRVACHDYDNAFCQSACIMKLICGHECGGVCGTCQNKGVHEACSVPCTRVLPCEHPCHAKCDHICGPCDDKCWKGCAHMLCTMPCSAECDQCHVTCTNACPHAQCTRVCHELCDTNPCDRWCSKLMPGCGHRCPGFCGEPCPPLCPKCEPAFYNETSFTLKTKTTRNERYVFLKPCRHILPASFMDSYVQRYLHGVHGKIYELKMLRCPVCDARIQYCPRYQEAIRFGDQDLKMVRLAYKSCQENRRRLAAAGHESVLALSERLMSEGESDYLYCYLGCYFVTSEIRQIADMLRYAKKHDYFNLTDYVEIDEELSEHMKTLDDLMLGFARKELLILAAKLNLLLLSCRAYMLPYTTTAAFSDSRKIVELTKLSRSRDSVVQMQRMLQKCCADMKHISPSDDCMADIRTYYSNVIDLRPDIQPAWFVCGQQHVTCVPATMVFNGLTHCPTCIVHRNCGLIDRGKMSEASDIAPKTTRHHLECRPKVLAIDTAQKSRQPRKEQSISTKQSDHETKAFKTRVIYRTGTLDQSKKDQSKVTERDIKTIKTPTAKH